MTKIQGQDKSTIEFNPTTILTQSDVETFTLTSTGTQTITGTITMPSGFRIKDPATGLWETTLSYTLYAYITDNLGATITDNDGEPLWAY